MLLLSVKIDYYNFKIIYKILVSTREKSVVTKQENKTKTTKYTDTTRHQNTKER